MAESNIPQLVDKKGGSYSAIALRLEVGFVNRLLEKWLSFSHGLRNANHIHTLVLDDIYEMFLYEDNSNILEIPLIQKGPKNIVEDFQEKSNDEVNEKTVDEYLRDLDIEFMKTVKAKLALFEAGPSGTQITKPFQSKNKGLVAKTVDYDEEKGSSDDEKMVQVKVLMILVEVEQLTIGKNHARNREITMKNRGAARSSTNNMDRAKKKMPTSSILWASSAAGSDKALDMLLVNKYTSQNDLFMSMKKTYHNTFFKIKRWEMKMQQKKLELKQQVFVFQQQKQ
uniref:Uncharacterized protein n=1 Tax=Tanacetum cinerariifolium TaxID=118510 RepID=A0A6L2MK96_TANCI|nr:hypothetical protein [Tanacetum cinerariifolium]